MHYFLNLIWHTHTNCMWRLSCLESGRLIKRSPSPPLDMPDIKFDNFSNHRNNQALQNLHDQFRTLRNFMYLIKIRASSCIVFFSLGASHFNFKSSITQLLPTFHDFESENPYLHFREFKEVCSTYIDQNYSINIIRLKFFYFSSKGKVKT